MLNDLMLTKSSPDGSDSAVDKLVTVRKDICFESRMCSLFLKIFGFG